MLHQRFPYSTDPSKKPENVDESQNAWTTHRASSLHVTRSDGRSTVEDVSTSASSGMGGQKVIVRLGEQGSLGLSSSRYVIARGLLLHWHPCGS